MFIALLEDAPTVGAITRRWLKRAGHHATSFATGGAIRRYGSLMSFDVFLLDWELPDMTGLEVLKQLKAQRQLVAPVLFLTVSNEETDVVAALNTGADDFLVKPVGQYELLSCINAVTRRSPCPAITQSEYVFGVYRFDLDGRRAFLEDKVIKLNSVEFALAFFLFENLGKLLSRELISSGAWGQPVVGLSRTVDSHVSRVRTKLDISPKYGYRLSAIYNAGYRLEPVSQD